MTFVQIPPQRRTLGTPYTAEDFRNDEPPFGIVINDGYWIGTHEVTRAQYRAVMGALPQLAAAGLEDDAPVDGVSWRDAMAFCTRLVTESGEAYGLPNAAQWEVACRDTEDSRPFSGTGVPDEMAWHAGNSGGKLHPVGRKLPNAYGLFDMHGNVAEWTSDPYWARHWSDADTQTREIRGGSATDPAERTKSAARDFGALDEPMPGVGFRVMKSRKAESAPTTATVPASDSIISQ